MHVTWLWECVTASTLLSNGNLSQACGRVLHGEGEMGASRVGWFKISPRRFKLLAFSIGKVPFRSELKGLVETGPATFPGAHPTRALMLGARPNLASKNAFPRSEGRKEQKEPFRYPFVTIA